MLVKRAQQWDESEMYWRGKSTVADTEEGDGDDDPRTDEELLDKLNGVSLNPLTAEEVADLAKWTVAGSKEELPDPQEDEDMVVTEDYDAKKAEEEEKKNQADTATFSGGGEHDRFESSSKSPC